MILILALAGLVVAIGLGIAGAATRKRLLLIAAAVVALIAIGMAGIVVLANSPLWTM